MALRLVYERGNDLVPRLIGRAALFQAYTGVLAAPGFAMGLLRAPPAFHSLNETYATPIIVAAWGVGFYLAVKSLNDRMVSKMSIDEKKGHLKLETISSSSRHDKVREVALDKVKASPFAPKAQQILRIDTKTYFVEHRGNKFTDVGFFTSLANRSRR
jgi:hypothetical protein